MDAWLESSRRVNSGVRRLANSEEVDTSMDPSIQLILAIWGAVLSTVLAIMNVAKEYRQRPKILIDATMSFRPCSEDEDTHGVKVKVQRGHDVLLEEALVEFTVRNAGLQPIQISAVYVKVESTITQVVPSGLPVVLQPNTSVTVKIQPELIAPLKLDEKMPKADNLLPVEVVSIGVYDALGKKHPIKKESLSKLVTSCRELPLRIGVFKHKETGNLVTAFQSKDQMMLINE